MDLAQIQDAVEALPQDRQARLAAWLLARDHTVWDRQIEQDSSPRAGMDLLIRTKE